MELAQDVVALQATALDVGAAIARAGEAESGGIAAFVGTTRSETNAAGQKLISLDYEAYHEMAEAQMRKLVEEARRRWNIGRVVLLHRTGVVEVGQPSVLVVVSTPHRAAAFEACRFLIDELKMQATIWKKEIWEDGATSWVAGHVR
jgi:molybdopterin synthase catalytic subunit